MRSQSIMGRGSVVLTCQYCDGLFRRPPSQASGAQGKFCSRHCAGAARRTAIELHCALCHAPFTVWPSRLVYGAPQFCSDRCKYAGRMEPISVRFWRQVERLPGDVCWLWTGIANNRGYGHLWYERRTVLAHRLSWLLHYGPIPDGLWVLHRCDTPACVRPDHLFLGDHAANMADMVAKERNWRGGTPGERNGSAKLTEAQVRAVRARYDAGESPTAIAAAYPVTTAMICHIGKRRAWTHVV